jgi:hypothetical protein
MGTDGSTLSGKSESEMSGKISGMIHSSEEQILQRLEPLHKVPARDPHAVRLSLAKVLGSVDSHKEGVSFSGDSRHNSKPQNSLKNPLRERLPMKTIGIILLVLALTFGGSVTTVQASQNSLPNELLYPVKLLSEDVQLGLSTNPERDIELLLLFAGERAEEIKVLLELDHEVSPTVLDRLDRQYEMALENAAVLSDQALGLTLQLMNAQLESQLQLFQQMQTKSEIRNQQQVEQLLRALEQNRVKVMDAQADPVGLRDRLSVERPEAAPDQPENVPGEGQGPGGGTGSGDGVGTGDGSGSGTGSGNGSDSGDGAGGTGSQGQGGGGGRGTDANQMDPQGTMVPGQSGQGEPRRGQ